MPTRKPISEAEMTMIRFLRRVGIRPDEAIARRLGIPRERVADEQRGDGQLQLVGQLGH